MKSMHRMKVGEVFATSDYSLFKVLKANRNVEPKRVEKIKESIQLKYIPAPIIVNEKMEVIDGQGRLQALKELGLPVYFYVIAGATIEDCALMNIYATQWSPYDIIKMYADVGNANYKRLYQLMEKHCLTRPTLIMMILRRKGNPFASNSVVRNFTASNKTENTKGFSFTDENYEKADYVLTLAEELTDIIYERVPSRKGKKEALLSACIECVLAEGYVHNKMKKALENNAHRFSAGGTKQEFLEMFARWYNKGKRQDFMDVYKAPRGWLNRLKVTFNASENRWTI